MRDDIRRRPASPPRSAAPAVPGNPARMRHELGRPAVTRTRSSDATNSPTLPAVPEPPAWPEEVYLRAEPRTWHTGIRRAAVTAVLGGLLVLVGLRVHAQTGQIASNVNGDVQAARTALQGGKESFSGGDYTAASRQFRVAADSLRRANHALAERGQLGGGTGPGGSLAAGSGLLVSGELVADSAARLAEQAAGAEADLAARQNDVMVGGEIVLQRLPELRGQLARLGDRLKLMEYYVGLAARGGGSGELRDAAQELAPVLPGLRENAEAVRPVLDELPRILGAEHFKQYLIWFQNPAELRPTGGFIRTYGRLTLDNGAVKELLVDSIYNPANQSRATTGDAPKPLGRFYNDNPNPPWHLQNTNWSPNLPEAYQKFAEYYERGGGPTTDGVIALTITPVIEILRIVGPIEMPEFGYTLNADNFQVLIQADQYYRSISGEADPKRILREFAPKLLGKINSADSSQKRQIVEVIGRAAAEKEITLHFTDDSAQRLLTGSPTEGVLRPDPWTLALVDANIGGFKSSTDMEVTVEQSWRIDSDGRAEVTLETERRHSNRTSSDTNQNYARFYLPKGAQVTKVAGFSDYGEVTQSAEAGFQVVGGWTEVPPTETRTSTIAYTLPHKVDLGSGRLPVSYQKQSGTRVKYRLRVELPPGYGWQSVVGDVDGNVLTLEAMAARDLRYDLRFGR